MEGDPHSSGDTFEGIATKTPMSEEEDCVPEQCCWLRGPGASFPNRGVPSDFRFRNNTF